MRFVSLIASYPYYSLCLCGSIDLLVFQFGQIFNASHISKHPGINPQNSLQGLQFTSKGLTSGFIVESTFALVQDYNSDFGKFDAVPPIFLITSLVIGNKE